MIESALAIITTTNVINAKHVNVIKEEINMTKKVEGAEARGLELAKLMHINKIKGTALSAVTHIGSANISLMRTGKMSITDKNWDKLQKGIEEILEGRAENVATVKVDDPGLTFTIQPVPVTEPIKVEVISESKYKHIKPFDLPPYIKTNLIRFGNTVVNRSTVGTDPQAFENYLESIGLPVTMRPDENGSWMITLKQPVSDEMVVKHSEPVKHAEVIPHMTDAEVVSISKALQATVKFADELYETSQPKPVEETTVLSEQEVDQIVKDVEKLKTVGDFLDDVFEDDPSDLVDETSDRIDPARYPDADKSPFTQVEQRCCLLDILSRNHVAIDMAELIGSVMVRRLRRESAILWSVIETLDNTHSSDAFKDYVKDVAAKLLEVASQ